MSAVAAARSRSTGRFSGYTQVYLSASDDQVLQGDTLIMPSHRGRRLGLRLKLHMLDLLAGEFPERSAVVTETAPDNLAMLRTNQTLGFRVIERLHQVQRHLD